MCQADLKCSVSDSAFVAVVAVVAAFVAAEFAAWHRVPGGQADIDCCEHVYGTCACETVGTCSVNACTGACTGAAGTRVGCGLVHLGGV